MTTVNPNTELQHGLGDYLLAVQKYGLVVQQLPASQQPAPLDKFYYPGNVHAIKRRTADVHIATQRLLKTALRPAPRAGPESKEVRFLMSVGVVRILTVLEHAPQKDAFNARNCGYPKIAVVSTICGASPSTEPENIDGHATNNLHVAAGHPRFPDRAAPVQQTKNVQVMDGQRPVSAIAPDPHGSADIRARIPTHDRSLLLTNKEVDLLIRLAAGLHDAARICARRISELKTHGASAGEVEEFLHSDPLGRGGELRKSRFSRIAGGQVRFPH
ncbi:hypothetical protein FN846DRAFT_885734 [Sphaerosporella brunnea]|uniref:Uncharacterized protein n=1 Tax=Sphaerosporella brunnea TaxID=1250544 RepID=A0A5J5FBU5_9PEZI|nr:hypothetical protein FN846DRAFT_885734 [Sphaerosporella brunnea]